jgi:hypothetical protein
MHDRECGCTMQNVELTTSLRHIFARCAECGLYAQNVRMTISSMCTTRLRALHGPRARCTLQMWTTSLRHLFGGYAVVLLFLPPRDSRPQNAPAEENLGRCAPDFPSRPRPLPEMGWSEVSFAPTRGKATKTSSISPRPTPDALSQRVHTQPRSHYVRAAPPRHLCSLRSKATGWPSPLLG